MFCRFQICSKAKNVYRMCIHVLWVKSLRGGGGTLWQKNEKVLELYEIVRNHIFPWGGGVPPPSMPDDETMTMTAPAFGGVRGLKSRREYWSSSWFKPDETSVSAPTIASQLKASHHPSPQICHPPYLCVTPDGHVKLTPPPRWVPQRHEDSWGGSSSLSEHTICAYFPYSLRTSTCSSFFPPARHCNIHNPGEELGRVQWTKSISLSRCQ